MLSPQKKSKRGEMLQGLESLGTRLNLNYDSKSVHVPDDMFPGYLLT